MHETRLSRIDRHLLGCAAIPGIAAIGALALDLPAAHADILYSSGPSVTLSSSLTTVLFKIDPGGTSFIYYAGTYAAGFAATTGYDFSISFYTGAFTFSYFSYNPAYATDLNITSYYSTSGYAYKYAADVTIDGSSTFVSETTAPNFIQASFSASTKWSTGDSGYIGFKLTSGGIDYYGWVGITISTSTSITVTGVGWQTDGTGILTGAVPEPGSLGLGLLALGAMGLTAWRRRRSG